MQIYYRQNLVLGMVVPAATTGFLGARFGAGPLFVFGLVALAETSDLYGLWLRPGPFYLAQKHNQNHCTQQNPVLPILGWVHSSGWLPLICVSYLQGAEYHFAY